MTFVRANALGWAPFELLLSTQMNTIDSQIPFALDGNAGGIYESSGILEYRNAMILSGNGVTPVDGLTMMLDVIGSLTFNNASTAEVAFQLTGHANLGAGSSGNAAEFTAGAATTGSGGLGLISTGGLTTAGTSSAGTAIRGTGGNSFGGQGGTGGDFRGGDSASGVAVAGLGMQVDGGEQSGSGTAGAGGDFRGGVQSGGGADTGGIGLNMIGGPADLTLGTGGAGAVITGGSGSIGGVGMTITGGGNGIFGQTAIVAQAGTGSTPNTVPAIVATGESDDGTASEGGAGASGVGGASSSSSGADQGGPGLIGVGGDASDNADGGQGGRFLGGDSTNGTGGIGLFVQAGGGLSLDGVGIQVESTNATGIVAETTSIGTASAGTFVHSGAASITRAALVARATGGASALRLEVDTAGGADDGAHIYFEDSAVDVGQFTTNGQMWFKTGSVTAGVVEADLRIGTSDNGLQIRLNGVTYKFVMVIA